MQLLVCPKTKDISFEVEQGITSFLLGLKGYTTNQDCCYTLEELKDLLNKYPHIEVFILLNKNLFNKDLLNIEEILKELDKLSLKGIFFYDQAILSIHQRLALKTPLVWNQTHLVTNYNTCNYYLNQGVSYALLASEITLDEMLEIRKKTSLNLMVTILGYPVMSHSHRKLLTNYFKFIHKEKDKKTYEITEPVGKQNYLVQEDETGTSFYDALLLNGTKPLFSLVEADFSYGVIFEKEIDNKKLSKIIPLYQKIMKQGKFTDEEKDSFVQEANHILQSDSTGFFYKRTIYKVKKNG